MWGREIRTSWLCRDESDRERLVDMEGRIKPVRTISFLLMAAGLVSTAPWIGWWTLIPLALAIVGFQVVDQMFIRLTRPEIAVAAAWLISQSLIATSVALTGGVTSPALGWLAIPLVTLSARFDIRGVFVGLGVTLALLLGATFAVDANHTAANLQYFIHALVLMSSVVLLSTALMSSDREHRSDSVIDGLTGMLNRRSLHARVRELAEQASRSGDSVGIVLGDIDHFKRVNDTHGHVAGDAVLVDIATALRGQLRAFDLAYRIGGEEFLVLLPGAREDDCVHVAELLRSAVNRSPQGSVDVTMSFGVASSEPGDFDFDETFARADLALYEAKDAGRDRVVGSDSLVATVEAAVAG